MLKNQSRNRMVMKHGVLFKNSSYVQIPFSLTIIPELPGVLTPLGRRIPEWGGVLQVYLFINPSSIHCRFFYDADVSVFLSSCYDLQDIDFWGGMNFWYRINRAQCCLSLSSF